tara:strand:+ start:25217 stop:25765 length:549 start_codon:yes stop_codon:yes gene_type:complete
MHIQDYDPTIAEFHYLKKWYYQINEYYKKYYGIGLVVKGEEREAFYYLDYNSTSRGNIPEGSRSFMKNEYIIIGLLLYKIKIIDRDVELESIDKFKDILKLEFEQYQQGLLKLIAKSNSETRVAEDDETIDRTIDSSFRQFRRLGWVHFDKDYFELRPAFKRLVILYEDVINNIEEHIKGFQ